MAFPTTWNTEPAGAGEPITHPLSKKGRAFLALGTTSPDVDADDVSPVITLTASNSVLGIDTNTALLAANGAFTCDVRWVVNQGGSSLASIIVAQLSSGTPAVFNLPPGQYLLVCTADATTTGEVCVWGRNE